MKWLDLIPFPSTVAVRQRFPDSSPVAIGPALNQPLAQLCDRASLPQGARIAVAVGSRGIDRLPEIVLATVETLKQASAQPFIVPAMGSHGGATPAGQVRLLADYGVTADTMGVPIESAMATDRVGQTQQGTDVHTATCAREADGIVLINRVKPHTDFGGAIGSGLMKMLVVGLGKHAGAMAFHRAAQRGGHEPALRSMAEVSLRENRILGGVAILEDQRHGTARLDVVPGEELVEREATLAAAAAQLMPRLPLADIDLLIVDRMGKNISGTGMDPNVIGRMIHGYSLIESELPKNPRIHRIFVRDLSPESHGNATGIGMADFTTTRLVEAMDREATYTNALTALSLQGSKIPIVFDTDREAVAAALSTLGLEDPRQARVVRIADTLSIENLQVSSTCLGPLRKQSAVEILGAESEMVFDPAGQLIP